MTLTILASVSLLALVSSARPLPSPKLDEDALKSLRAPASGEEADANIQQVIQAVVKSHTSDLGDVDLKEKEGIHIQIASSEEVQAYLSSTDSDAIKALIPLTQDELHSPDEKELYELLNRLEEKRSSTPVPDEALDSIDVDSVASLPSGSESTQQAAEISSENSTPEREKQNDTDASGTKEFFVSAPIIVTAVSCVIAMLAVGCIAAGLYLGEILRKSIFRSTFDILPQLEKNVESRTGGKGGVSERGMCEAIEGDSVRPESESTPKLEKEKEKVPDALIENMDSTRPPPLRTNFRIGTVPILILPEAGSDGSDFGDDLDEKFFDAESRDSDNSASSTPPYPPTPRSEETEKLPSPPGLTAVAAATATATAAAIAQLPEMREVPGSASSPDLVSIPGSFSSRPSWSIRAQEAGALIHAQDNASNHEEQQGRRRGGVGLLAAPQIDAALAMQLRPGLGIGADAAWLVRFVMALFGWCAVLMSGRTWGM